MADLGEVPSIEFRPIIKATSKQNFLCGEKDVDAYFRRDALKKHDLGMHRVSCAHLKGSPTAAGFYSLAAITENIKKLPGSYHAFGSGTHFPCLQLVWLGVDRSMQRRTIGLRLLGKAVTTFAEVGSLIGLPHLIVVPISDAVKPFYRKLGFEDYDAGEKMFLPLQSAVEATA